MDITTIIISLALGVFIWRLKKVESLKLKAIGYMVAVMVGTLLIIKVATDGKYLSGTQMTLCFVVLCASLFGLARVTPSPARNIGLVVVIGFFGALLVQMTFGLESMPTVQRKPTPVLRQDASPRALPPSAPKTVAAEKSTDFREIALIEEAKDAIKLRLKDPSSAQFRGVFYHYSKNVGHVVCGQVNGKNALGGYTGFTRFVSNGQPSVTFLATDTTDFNTIWRQICVE